MLIDVFILWLFFGKILVCYGYYNTSLQTNTGGITDVCGEWEKNQNKKDSYLLEISVGRGTNFCSGILVDEDWVLTSFSCFQKIFHNESYLSNSTNNCFDLKQENNADNNQVFANSTTNTCVTIQKLYKKEIMYLGATVNFGVVHENYYAKNISWTNADDNTQNYRTVHVNDFLLLKLENDEEYSELHPVNLKTVPKNYKNYSYKVYLQMEFDTLFFGWSADILGEGKNNSFECSQNFYDTVCAQNQQICDDQDYLCAEFNLEKIADDRYSYKLNSGDPLVLRKLDWFYSQIYGFFSTDFIPQDIPTENQLNYSFDSNGAVFVKFTENHSSWIKQTIKKFGGDNCSDINEDEHLPVGFLQLSDQTFQNDYPTTEHFQNIIVIDVLSSVIFVIFVIVVIIVVYSYGKRSQIREGKCLFLGPSQKQVQKDSQRSLLMDEDVELQSFQNAGASSDLKLSEMVGLQENFAGEDDSRCEVFRDLPNWWSGIQIPQGVRDIPINDLVGIKRLGVGGFAVVYEAKFAEHAKKKYKDISENQFAVKIIFKEYFQIKDQMETILKEVAAMSKLQSKYIVKLIGASLVIRPSIVMELVSGGSLEDLLNTEGYKSYQTSLEWKLKLFLNISRGIQYLHSQRILHRDLKPANILVQNPHTPIIKISDFGLAKIKHTSQALGNTKNGAGTKHYMAPEMYDESASIDEKVDIWALAVIMQQVLRGIKPWKDQLEQFVICRVSLHKEPPDNGILPQYCPQELSLLVKKCWKPSAERPTAEHIVEQLQHILQTLSYTNINGYYPFNAI